MPNFAYPTYTYMSIPRVLIEYTKPRGTLLFMQFFDKMNSVSYIVTYVL